MDIITRQRLEEVLAPLHRAYEDAVDADRIERHAVVAAREAAHAQARAIAVREGREQVLQALACALGLEVAGAPRHELYRRVRLALHCGGYGAPPERVDQASYDATCELLKRRAA